MVKRHTVVFAAVTTVMLVLDQITKAMIQSHFALRERLAVIDGFFNLTYVQNPGAAWGMLANSEYRVLFFSVVAIGAFGICIYYLRQLKEHEGLIAWALGMIASGALGNLIDRWRFGKVTDFLDFYANGDVGVLVAKIIGHNHWPTFNVADIGITVGVALFAVHILFFEKKGAATGGDGVA